MALWAGAAAKLISISKANICSPPWVLCFQDLWITLGVSNEIYLFFVDFGHRISSATSDKKEDQFVLNNCWSHCNASMLSCCITALSRVRSRNF